MGTKELPPPLPLDEFPAEKRERIEWLASQPTPPAKYITFHMPPGRPYAEITSRAYWEWWMRRGRDIRLQPVRDKIPHAVRLAVIARDGLVCGICGLGVLNDDVHLDHIHPWSKGGRHTVQNLRVTHSICNIRKGARDAS